MSNGGVIPAALGVFAGGRRMVHDLCDRLVIMVGTRTHATSAYSADPVVWCERAKCICLGGSRCFSRPHLVREK